MPPWVVPISTLVATLVGGLLSFLVQRWLSLRREHVERVQSVATIVMDRALDRQVFDKATQKVRPLQELRLQVRGEVHKAKLWNFWSESAEPGGVWNRTAYHLSETLERLGHLVLSGVLPLRSVLDYCATMVVRDWVVSFGVTDTLRAEAEPRTSPGSGGAFPFRRRHAEWLMAVSVLYLEKRWGSDFVDSEVERTVVRLAFLRG